MLDSERARSRRSARTPAWPFDVLGEEAAPSDALDATAGEEAPPDALDATAGEGTARTHHALDHDCAGAGEEGGA